MLYLLSIKTSIIIGSLVVFVLLSVLVILSVLVKKRGNTNVSTINTKNVEIKPIEIDKDEIELDNKTIYLNLLKGRSYSVGGGNKVKPGEYKIVIEEEVISILHNNMSIDVGVNTVINLVNGDTICSKNSDLKLELK